MESSYRDDDFPMKGLRTACRISDCLGSVAKPNVFVKSRHDHDHPLFFPFLDLSTAKKSQMKKSIESFRNYIQITDRSVSSRLGFLAFYLLLFVRTSEKEKIG